jgi:hypothetical protein
MCDCIKKINAGLAASEFPNTLVEYPLFGPQVTFVVTCKRSDRAREKPKRMLATYCPFCGEKYNTRAYDEQVKHG